MNLNTKISLIDGVTSVINNILNGTQQMTNTIETAGAAADATSQVDADIASEIGNASASGASSAVDMTSALEETASCE